MGVLDVNKDKLTCLECRISETLTAVEKGSCYGSSGWGGFNQSEHFEITSINESGIGPRIGSAKCKTCGNNAAIECCE